MKKLFCLVFFMIVLGGTVANAAQFSADMVVNIMGMKQQGKLYYKNADVSRSELMGVVSIVNSPKVYQVYEKSKKYVVTDMADAAKENPAMDVSSFKAWIKGQQLKKIASEKISGYKCDVYEGDVQPSEEQSKVHMKVWFSSKLEYPIRTEMKMGAPLGSIVTFLDNIKTGKQDAALFTVPADYIEVDDVTDAMEMEMFSGGSQNGQNGKSAPSSEDMMKMLENMMKSTGNE